jgi:hypothetical protein
VLTPRSPYTVVTAGVLRHGRFVVSFDGGGGLLMETAGG